MESRAGLVEDWHKPGIIADGETDGRNARHLTTEFEERKWLEKDARYTLKE